MNKLFTLQKSDYEPISFRSKYLYQDFNAVRSMLRNQKLGPDNINQLLEPKLIGDNIEWFGNFSGEFERISKLDADLKDNILKQFGNFNKQVEDIISRLSSSTDADSNEWGKYFTELFNPASIILLGNKNSKEWVMLWGFNFLTGNENRLNDGINILGPKKEGNKPDEFIKPKDPIIEKDKKNNSDPKKIDDSQETKEVYKSDKPYATLGFWGRVRHWLRWISYRFWGLFWLIIYTLLIIWFCRYCDKPNCDEYCKELKKTKKELERLEERVRERCDTTYVKTK